MKKRTNYGKKPIKGAGIKRQKVVKHLGLKISLCVFLLMAATVLIAASIIFRFDEWHSFQPELIVDCDKSVRIYDSDGELLCIASGGEKRIWVSIDSIPTDVVEAFVAAEDARFYTHDGVDIIRIFGAAWADIKAGGYVQGASTISQQLIKLSHLSAEKTLNRKLEEAVLARTLERHYDKDQIMEMYLNYVYFGGGYYGIEAASRGYFGISVNELTNAQAAQLAGILKSPSNYAPHLDMEASLGRRGVILGLMLDYGYLSQPEYDSAMNEECVLNKEFPTERTCSIDYALNEACKITGMSMDELLVSGASVYTTIDNIIDAYGVELINNPEMYPSDYAQGALAVLRNDGSIAAMVGGRGEYDALSLNRAADMERQPGSLIKPVLVYAPALEKYDYTAATLLYDSPKEFGDYSPRNSDDKYYGWVTMRTAVTKSLNVPAVDVLSDIGLPSACMFAESVGISFENEQLGLSLALGGFTYGVSPLEMAGAYSSFANGGVYIEPTCIERIVMFGGEIVHERSVSGIRAMSAENAYILTSMLKSVAKEGTGKRLSELALPIAAKTGTSVDSNGVRDAWCAVYSSDYTAVTWMGTDDSSHGSLPSDAVGGKYTAIILAELFSKLYNGKECKDFPMPEGITTCRVDSRAVENGNGVLLAATMTPEKYSYDEYFITGTAPTDTDPYWDQPTPPDEIGWSMSLNGYPVISFVAENSHLIYKVMRTDQKGSVKKIGESQGSTGLISISDSDTVPGAIYGYYIIAVHPEMTDAEKEVASESSRVLRVVIPFA